ncbi:hypothetical protein ANACOL_04160 [Anaerotruncus colihominis DSM 17241]|uniref:Uncharacterized protein n=1 Tax=Anaerotruncus colihominis DSM 17241 TaxID=445972 RepID=B0PGK6_9FIRM|nr:hypothetical protein ANACOL_04160 [Anaerotruncus colihominis DSM 17241]
MVQRPIQHHFALGGGVDGVVDIERGVVDGIRHTERVSGKSQIIVPWEDLEKPIFLIQEISMHYAAQIAVHVHHKYLYGIITKHLIHIDGSLQILACGKDF